MLSTMVAIVDRNRHTPRTLTRDNPVPTICDHVINAVMTPFRNPLYLLVDGFQCFLTVAIHRGEPLFCSTIDNRIFTTPAMGILVTNIAFLYQRTIVSQDFDHWYFCIVDFNTSQWLFCITIARFIYFCNVTTSSIN